MTMSAEQKRAWLCVWSMAGCLVGFAILIPFIGASRAIGAFCLFSVNGFAPLIGRRTWNTGPRLYLPWHPCSKHAGSRTRPGRR